MTQYKIVLLGDGNVGKTAWAIKLFAKTYKNHMPTLGCEVYTYKHFDGTIFNLWDTAGQDEFGGLRDGYYIMANAALVFHGVTNSKPASNNWVRDFKRVCDMGQPILHVFAKSDLMSEDDKVDALKKYPDAIFLSSKNDDNVLAPITELLKLL